MPLKNILCAFVCLTVYTCAVAQIVNVEGERGGIDSQGWHGSVQLHADITQNISKVITYGMNGNVQYLKHRHKLLFLADLDRILAGGRDFVNSGYNHLRYNINLDEKKRFAWEVFHQIQFNPLQKLSYRNLVGTGLRWSVAQSDSSKCWLGTLPMFEFEVLTTGIIERNLRQSTYLHFVLVRKKFEFQSISYYQPRWDNPYDFRLSSSTALELGILNWLRFVTSFQIFYDSQPPDAIPHLFYSFKNGLKLEF